MTYMYKNYCECPILQSARADGHALGGGFVLTLCFDYRLAVADDASCFIDAHLTNRCFQSFRLSLIPAAADCRAKFVVLLQSSNTI